MESTNNSPATKQTLATALVNEYGLNAKAAKNAVNTIFDVISNELIDKNTVEIHGFGKFRIEKVKKRAGVNPATGEKIIISSRQKPKFIPSKNLKEAVNPQYLQDQNYQKSKIAKKKAKVKSFANKINKKYASLLNAKVPIDNGSNEYRKLTVTQRSIVDGSDHVVESFAEIQKRANEVYSLLGSNYVELNDIQFKNLTKRELLNLIVRMTKKVN